MLETKPNYKTYLRSNKKGQLLFWEMPDGLCQDEKQRSYHCNDKSEPHEDAQKLIEEIQSGAVPHNLQEWLDRNQNDDSIMEVGKSALFLGTEHKIYIELAVLGGNIFRLLLGIKQPKYYSVQQGDDVNINVEYFRLSSDVEQLKIEPVDFSGNKFLLDNLFSPCLQPIASPPVIGYFMQIVFSYFIGDIDWKNFGIIQDNDIQRVIRFDPEYSFFKLFWFCNTFRNIEKHLEYFANDDIDPEEVIYKESRFLFEPEEYFEDDIKINRGNINVWRVFEVYAALARIISMPFERYEKLIDKYIDPKYEIQIALLKNIFKKRLDLFQKVSMQLKDFPKFYELYQHDTDIGGFWRNFHDPVQAQCQYIPYLYRNHVEQLEQQQKNEKQERKRKLDEEQQRDVLFRESFKKLQQNSYIPMLFSHDLTEKDMSKKQIVQNL